MQLAAGGSTPETQSMLRASGHRRRTPAIYCCHSLAVAWPELQAGRSVSFGFAGTRNLGFERRWKFQWSHLPEASQCLRQTIRPLVAARR